MKTQKYLSFAKLAVKMNHEDIRNYCLRQKGVSETLPFGPDTLVFRVADKIYALLSLDEVECRVNLKCDPERAINLRETYPDAIIPGYHMNKMHWNTVYTERGLPEKLIFELIEHSYDLVVNKMSKKSRDLLDELGKI